MPKPQASTLELDQSPARLGGYVSGLVRAPLALSGAEIYLEFLAIECTFGEDFSALWRRIVLLDGEALARGPDHLPIPFSVLLPADGKATSDRVNWSLRVRATVPGLKYVESFDIPVSEAQGTEPAGSPPRTMPVLVVEHFKGRSQFRIDHLSDGAVLHFPVPSPFPAFTLLLIPAGIAAFADHPVVKGLPFDAAKWGWIVFGGYSALMLAPWLIAPRRLEVRPDMIRIERGPMGVGLHRTIARADVSEVVETASSGTPFVRGPGGEPALLDRVTYGVEIRTRVGKSHEVASQLRDLHEALWITGKLRRIIRGA